MSTCHIYFYDGWLSVSPTTISVAKILGKSFEKVIIYAQNTQFKNYKFEEKNIEVRYIYNSFYWKKSDKPLNFAKKVKKIIKNFNKQEDWFLCIDTNSLEPVSEISAGSENIMYLSLELPNTQNTYSQKQCEMFNRMKVVMVQDENRLTPAEAMEEKDVKSELENALKRLPERERMIMVLYYHENMTLKEIGETIEVSESRVCQLHAQAIMKLKNILSENRVERLQRTIV